jgi:hypothetical protein
MGLAHSPGVVSDGLVLALDAGNPKSYPGSGTTWTDLGGNNNNGTLVNGPSYNSSNGGSIVFDGTNDGVQLPHNSFWVISPSDKFSFTSWFYAEPTTQNGSMILSHQRCNNPGFQLTVNDTTSLAFRVAGNLSVFATYSSNVTGRWNYVVSTFNGINGDMKLYLNGDLVATNTNTSGWNNYNAGGSDVWLGRRTWCGGTNEFTGKIASFSYYKGRELLLPEVKQNYNALRGRFGV